MSLKEISDLINIRNYLSNSILNNFNIDKKFINKMSVNLNAIDNLLAEKLTSDEFSKCIENNDFEINKSDQPKNALKKIKLENF